MRSFVKIFISSVILASIGCSSGTVVVNENAEIAKKVESTVAAAPTKTMLVELETKAFEAWKKKDAAFWNTHLDDRFVSFTDGKRADKAGEIKMLSESKCDITSHAFSDEKMVPVGNDAIILTAKATIEGSCAGKKLPSPITFGTLYVRSGETWKAAYHNEVPIVDLKAFKPNASKAEPSDGPTEDSDPFASRLVSIEKRAWEALRSKNRSQIEASMTEDVTLIDQTGKVTVGKKDVVGVWTDPTCDIKSASPIQATASEVSDIIAILTYKGTMAGTCEGQPVSDFWGTTIFQKDGGEWKAVYQFRTPA